MAEEQNPAWPDWLRDADISHERKVDFWHDYQELANSHLPEERKRVLLKDMEVALKPLHPGMPEEDWPLWLKHSKMSRARKLKMLAAYETARIGPKMSDEEFKIYLESPQREARETEDMERKERQFYLKEQAQFAIENEAELIAKGGKPEVTEDDPGWPDWVRVAKVPRGYKAKLWAVYQYAETGTDIPDRRRPGLLADLRNSLASFR